MKYCCNSSNTNEKSRFKNRTKIKVGIVLIFIGISLAVLCTEGILRSVLKGYPMAAATTLSQRFSDLAMKNTLKKYGYNSSQIDRVKYSDKGEVLSVETDTNLITKIKTDFSEELSKLYLKQGDDILISVPLGTLIGSDVTIGMGPEIKFKLRYSCTATISYKSDFTDAGVNNTYHTIKMNVASKIYIMLPFSKCSESINSEYLLAETVIVGKVPEAYTNVYDGVGDVADDICNYGAEVK